MKITYFNNGLEVSSKSRPMSIHDILRCRDEYLDERSSKSLKESHARLLGIPNEYTAWSIEPEGLMLDSLAPCTFCGSVPSLDDPDFLYPTSRNRDEWGAHCCAGGCGCGNIQYAASPHEAIAAWNRPYASGTIKEPVKRQLENVSQRAYDESFPFSFNPLEALSSNAAYRARHALKAAETWLDNEYNLHSDKCWLTEPYRLCVERVQRNDVFCFERYHMHHPQMIIDALASMFLEIADNKMKEWYGIDWK